MTKRAHLIRLGSGGRIFGNGGTHTKFSPLSTAVAVGSFDGLHRGHQKVLRALREKSGGGTTVLASFYPHPSVVLGKVQAIPKITTLQQRLWLLGEWGVDYLALIRFSKILSRMNYKDFFDIYLRDALGCKAVVLGPDARMGAQGEGTAVRLQEYGGTRGCEVSIVEEEQRGEGKVGSREIRDAVARGEFRRAYDLLGRWFELDGCIVRGEGRGFAIPTATLHTVDQILPPAGVYCGEVLVENEVFQGVMNRGVQPTFGGETERLEFHAIDAPALSLYGKRVQFRCIQKIREERAFLSVGELHEQIKRDIENARGAISEAKRWVESLSLYPPEQDDSI